MSTRQGKKGWLRRRAAAVVEMAVVTPLLLLLLFGIIEYGWIFTVRQGLVTAAREGARTAALPGSTEAEVAARINEFLAPLGITTYTYTLTRAGGGSDAEVVQVTVPYADVTLLGSWFGSTDFNLGATCSMRKEGLD